MIVWDEKKRLINLRKHGFDFEDAHLVYNDPAKMTISTSRSGEDRRMDTAFVRMLDSVLAFVYVERSGDVRAISFRRASRRERRLYAKFKQEESD